MARTFNIGKSFTLSPPKIFTRNIFPFLLKNFFNFFLKNPVPVPGPTITITTTTAITALTTPAIPGGIPNKVKVFFFRGAL